VIENRIIVTLGSSWDYDPTSKHQVMKVLAERNTVVWINYHGTRRPRAGRHDLSGSWSVLSRVARGVRSVSPSMVQMTPLVIPGARSAAARMLHERMLILQIRRAIASVEDGNRRPIQVWSFAPDVPFLVGRLNEECFVYYCVDDYTQFEGFDTQRIAQAESELLQCADVVVTSSEPLWECKRQQREDAVLLRHGVDYEHFAQAWRSPPARPESLRGLLGPIFGYFGLIHHWVDVDLLAAVARRRPDWSFVLIGDCKVDVTAVRRLSNVRLIGRRPYNELPAYCAAFDAALMLFRQNAMTRCVNPIKMYEYLAAGLPIVSTPLPEANRYSQAIRFADSPEAFIQECEATLRETHPDRNRHISSLVAGEAWRSKVETLSAIIH